ncbi:Signal transducer and activator of transcription 5B [Armadillidium nasatum]|uniref:Signal transducer and activator of transcription n=1 Tax=Armadillidium nasatum TaxID=96803 RepID=A0A5N5TH79_9CRUS|nr:Signal transducer and activator of transcription 5B [Armadillidium nasatum]
MSLWNRAQQLPPDLLRQVYGETFPIEVRHYLASWIEDNLRQWSEIEVDNHSHAQFAASVLQQLIAEIEAKAGSYSNQDELFLTRIKLQEAAVMFKTRYQSDPLSLIATIRNCINREHQLIQQNENVMNSPGGMMQSNMVIDPSAEIVQQLEVLKARTRETADDLRQLASDQESFALQYHNCTSYDASFASAKNHNVAPEVLRELQMKKQESEMLLNQRASGLINSRMNLQEKHKVTIDRLAAIQQRILDEELINWKKEQRMAGNGRLMCAGKLDQIQAWCDSLAEIIWLNRHQIKECERHLSQMPLKTGGYINLLPTLNEHITRLLSSLVTSTFIIEKEPPQVMKTNTRFTSTVRLLVGGKLNVNMTPPQVRVTIISECQAQSLLQTDSTMKNDASGEILNNTGTMEYNQSNRQLSVTFRNMQLRKIKRAEKKGTESVMDEKFALLFQSQFSVGGGELVFQVWTLSLPVVVIVHGNQEPHAWATISWDNAFTEQGRIPFQVPEQVPWPQVAEMLNMKFASATGKGLSPENLDFLASKAFRSTQSSDYSQMLLSWSQFCKEPLPDRNFFTFWEWFYGVMKVTREHLRQLWNDNSIMGFVGRRQAEEMLKECASGTFLLRFSDSELGGVTIAWMYEDQSKGDQRDVFMVQPFTSKDFAIRPLADRINDLPYFIFLYPNRPKDQAFGKYYTPIVSESSNTPGNGYVKPHLVNIVPGFPGPGSSDMFSIYGHTDASNPPSVSSVNSAVEPTNHLDKKPVMESPLFDAANVLSNFPS